MDDRDVFDNDNSGPSIIKDELEKVLTNMKDRTATGIDRIPAETLKNPGKDMYKLLYAIINKVMKLNIFWNNLSKAGLNSS